jgi:hypothetical protein
VQDLLLDTYTGAAAAYSVRKLDKDYTGSCMRIRRSSDEATQDIGFDSNGDLDTAAIASFVGDAYGYVTAWYDQSGNGNNATQSTSSSQPMIYDRVAAAVVTENGKPIIQSSSSKLLETTVSLGTSSWHFGVYKGTDNIYILHSYGSAYWGFAFEGGSASSMSNISGLSYYHNGTLMSSDTRDDIHSALSSQGLMTTTHSTSGSNLKIGHTTSVEMPSVQELILYDSDQSSNRSGIETNINTYFSIYT